MTIIDWFQQVDKWLGAALPRWPVSLIMFVCIGAGFVLTLLWAALQ
jgi:hypothetical protein